MNLVDRHLAPAWPDAATDAASFLRWAEGREGRYEWVEGRVVMMTGATKNHAIIALRIGAQLLSQLDQTTYQVCAADLGVRTRAGVRYPNIIVDVKAAGTGSHLSATAPVFIAEVLSPSSISVDMVEKAAEYTSIESLRAYAVFSQDRAQVWIWSQGPSGWPAKPKVVEGLESSLSVETLGLVLPLAGIFRDIGPVAPDASSRG